MTSFSVPGDATLSLNGMFSILVQETEVKKKTHILSDIWMLAFLMFECLQRRAHENRY